MDEQLAHDLGAFLRRQAYRDSATFDDDAQALIDGPLSDLSVLARIPAVRELLDAAYEYQLPDEWRHALRSLVALEATDG